jgi:hypothetical protein
MEVKLILTNTEHKELISYCNLNDLLVSSVVKQSFTTGFNIERYGLLGDSPKETEVIKEVEVVKEVPVEKIVEVIKQVEVIKEVPIEVKVIEYVDREVVREVPVEKVVEKIVNIYDNSQIDELLLKIQQLEERKPEVIEKVVGDETKQRMLEQTLQTLRADNFNKDKRIKELEEIVSDFKKYEQKMGAVFLRGTNLDDTLFK